MKANRQNLACKIWAAIINPAVLCLFLPILQGGGAVDFASPAGFWGQFAVAVSVSSVFSIVLPIGKVSDACCHSFGIERDTAAHHVFKLLFNASMLFALVGLGEVVFLTGLGEAHGQTLFARWTNLFVPFWPFVALAGFVTEPICKALSMPFASAKTADETNRSIDSTEVAAS